MLAGTFVLRFASGLTGAMLVYYLAELHLHGGEVVTPITVAFLTAGFFVAELVLSPIFGLLSDRFGHHRIMELGPVFGMVAVIITGLTTNIPLLGTTRLLEGASTAASVPSVLGFIAVVTMHDELLRGRVAARFELVTVAGVGGGIAAGGLLWTALGPTAFFVNAGLYFVAQLIYRFGVTMADEPGDKPVLSGRGGLARYRFLLRSSHVWLLAPTWIAINAALGLYTSQTLFQLVQEPDPRFEDQLLVGGFTPLAVTAGFALAGIVFFAGLIYWGERFKRFRRTTIIVYGLLGGAVLAGAALAINHSGDLPLIARVPLIVDRGVGLFVLAGATPAAIGLLADMSERFPDDRGAFMGLYTVFFGLGQIIGLFLGGVAAESAALDGIFMATFVLLGVALVPLSLLRRFEETVRRYESAEPEGAFA